MAAAYVRRQDPNKPTASQIPRKVSSSHAWVSLTMAGLLHPPQGMPLTSSNGASDPGHTFKGGIDSLSNSPIKAL